MPEILIGALPILLALVALAWGFSWLARRQQIRGKWLGIPHMATISWLGTFSEAFQRALDILPRLGASIIDADPYRGTVLAGTEGSLKTLGTTVKISLTTQEGVTFVRIEAAPSAFFGAGESRELVKEFLVQWERLPSPVAD